MNRYKTDEEHRKVLRTIDTSKRHPHEVTDNIYGYTSVFSNRPVTLEAIAKSFTSTYSVSQEDLFLCIGKTQADFEYYHEIKSRIDQSSICEEWEAPDIKNIREHYCPSLILVIKKYKKDCKNLQNRRKAGKRNHKSIRKCDLVAGYFNKDRIQNDFPSCEEKTIEFTRQKP